MNRLWAICEPGKARNQAERLAEIVGCGGKKDKELLECLQNTCPKRLIRAEIEFLVSITLQTVFEGLANSDIGM